MGAKLVSLPPPLPSASSSLLFSPSSSLLSSESLGKALRSIYPTKFLLFWRVLAMMLRLIGISLMGFGRSFKCLRMVSISL